MTTDSPTDLSKNAPAVSVVVPTCNRRPMLQRCLEALAAQSHENYEIIVVDDCSTDDTPDFLKRFADRHPNLKLRCLRNQTHAGANPSRNRGIEIAAGDFVAFLDSDCIADPDWLEQLLRGFTSDRVAAVVGMVDSPLPTNVYELTLRGTHRVPGPGVANRLLGGNMCVRRALLLKHV
ncbi:MAG: glycosyltransferase family 2 protein, partial [Planctomycetes bacterium]|nr:glycosyltransferase family 2 protein [Planctomycetota bacterium]